MRKFIFLIVVVQCCLLGAQTQFTERLQKSTSGQGAVILHQSSTITELVNGTAKAASATASSNVKVEKVKSATTTIKQDSLKSQVVATTGQKISVNGYRIQVYSGGNSRQAKYEAMQMQNKVKSLYAGVTVYTHFQSPHWICRVGDFRTYEEANEMYSQLKGTFSEAVIVRSKVNVYY